jgi:hypothetical protein
LRKKNGKWDFLMFNGKKERKKEEVFRVQTWFKQKLVENGCF